MAGLLEELGVPRARILLEETGTSTLSSVRAVRRMRQAHRLRGRVYAATSFYHLPRCLMLLRLADIAARACPPAGVPGVARRGEALVLAAARDTGVAGGWRADALAARDRAGLEAVEHDDVAEPQGGGGVGRRRYGRAADLALIAGAGWLRRSLTRCSIAGRSLRPKPRRHRSVRRPALSRLLRELSGPAIAGATIPRTITLAICTRARCSRSLIKGVTDRSELAGSTEGGGTSEGCCGRVC